MGSWGEFNSAALRAERERATVAVETDNCTMHIKRPRGAHQCYDSRSSTGKRNNVEVVGQVELQSKTDFELVEGQKKKKDPMQKKCPAQQHLTSLVLQMSPRVAPQAFPGVAFQGMIPVGSKP